MSKQANTVEIGGKLFPVHVVDGTLITSLSTLEASDIGREYIIVQGTIQFVGTETGLDFEAIRREMEAEDWQADDSMGADGDTQVRRVLLGSVFALCPSGKVYMPFACSNLDPCPVCAGDGNIGGHKKRRVRKGARSRCERITRLALKRYGAGSKGVMKSAPLRNKLMRMALGVTCPRCDGCGSHEAADDARWREAVEERFEALGWSLENGEGDPCDLFAAEYRDTPEDDADDAD